MYHRCKLYFTSISKSRDFIYCRRYHMMKNMNKKSICSSGGGSITIYHESMITNDILKLNDMIIKTKVLRLRSMMLQTLAVVIFYTLKMIHIMIMILRMLIT